MDPITVGTAQNTTVLPISTSEDLKVLLRVGWTPKTEQIVFHMAEDLKIHEMIRVTVEKISEAPATQTNTVK